METKSCLIAYDNRADEGTMTGEGWSAELPLKNMQNKILTKVARIENQTANFSLKWDRPIPIRVIGLIRHNLSQEATVNIKLKNSANNTIYESSKRWKGRPFIMREWADPDFIAGEPRDTFRSRHSRITYIDCGRNFGAKSIDVSVTEQKLNYIQVGRLFVGKAWSPKINYQSGQKIWYEQITDKRRALGGTLYTDLRANYRVIQFGLSYLTQDEALGYAMDMQKNIGDSDECLVNLDPDNTVYPYAMTLMGRVRQLSPIEQIARIEYPFSTAYEIEEIV